MTINLNTELKNRIKRLQDIIVKEKVDGCIINSSVNLFYLCDFIFDGFLYILPEGNPIFFIKRPIGIEGDDVFYIRKPEQILDLLSSNLKENFRKPNRIFIENDVTSYNTVIRIQNALGNPEMVNVSGIMRDIRALKSNYEIDQMRKNAKLQADVYRKIPSIYKPGITDIEYQIEVEYLMRKNGSLGVYRSFGSNMDIFMGTVLVGDNAHKASPFDFALGGSGMTNFLPIGASGTKLEEGQTILFDMAGNYSPWQTDMSRTFAIGKVSEKVVMAHNVSIEMHNWILDNVKEGTLCSDIYNYCIDTAKKYNFSEYFMGIMQQAKFVGHGLGLEINEPPVLSPRSKDVLKENMTFAFEPKFVLPKIGPAGIENTYLVKKDGLEKITICEEDLICLK
ncbi:MAG: M24 family metallopeptidase [Bacteroidales bacterium]|jgi:Xaa-Pro aminopeptidase